MTMRKLYTYGALLALGVGLIALPSSARQQTEPGSSLAELQARLHNLGVRAQELQRVLPLETGDLDDAGDADDEVEVLVGPNSSWLGVSVEEITSENVKNLGLPAERGALIRKIVPDSPAAKTGLKENDVITEINGQRVEGTAQFRRMIREIPAGRAVQLTVWRGGRTQHFNVTLGKSEPRGAMRALSSAPGSFAFHMPNVPVMPELDDLHNFSFSFSGQPRLGIDAENLEGDFGKYFGAPEGEGVLVRQVFDGSAAAKAGLKAGDVITSVDGERIRTVSKLREKLAERKEQKTTTIGLLRNKSELSLSVELPPPPEKHERHLSERTNI